MRKFKAPADTTAIHFSTGRHVHCDKKGVGEFPDDLADSEIMDLRRDGWVEQDEDQPATKASAGKTDAGATDTAKA